MSRRALTTFLAVVLAAALAVAGALQTVPYVLLSPGPAFNTLGTVGSTQVLTIKGGRTYPTDGALEATTVSVTDHVTLFEALRGWVSRDDAVIPREIVYPPDRTQQQTDQQNAQDMRQSQDDATVAAMAVLGITGHTEVGIAVVNPKGPADGRLQVGDVLTAVDGKRVTSLPGLRSLISARRPGAAVKIGYTRGTKPGTVTLRTTASPDSPPRAVIGIQAMTRSEFPVKVDIKLRDVGGPSAGLMFALGIVDKLQPGSLTGGRVVAGTGEIDEKGKVGAIGGIAQKMRGARAARATVFLVPAANCDEARRTRPKDLRLVRVTTLQSALDALAALRRGADPASC
ncbi:MAG TPA: PDZ domain-containing protein [Mycobacteriales bacterium]|nr:PDZ domain-containing protein [Mycobacteriales bacterium]